MNTKIIAIVFLGLFFISCNNTENNNTTQLPSSLINNPQTSNKEAAKVGLPIMHFDFVDFDFGLIFEGEQVVHKYKFKNTGDAPLIISDVSASCGCTVPSYPNRPIAVGDEGFIEVKFDSGGRSGMQHKTLTILANTQPNRITLSFVAEVEIPN